MNSSISSNISLDNFYFDQIETQLNKASSKEEVLYIQHELSQVENGNNEIKSEIQEKIDRLKDKIFAKIESFNKGKEEVKAPQLPKEMIAKIAVYTGNHQMAKTIAILRKDIYGYMKDQQLKTLNAIHRIIPLEAFNKIIELINNYAIFAPQTEIIESGWDENDNKYDKKIVPQEFIEGAKEANAILQELKSFNFKNLARGIDFAIAMHESQLDELNMRMRIELTMQPDFLLCGMDNGPSFVDSVKQNAKKIEAGEKLTAAEEFESAQRRAEIEKREQISRNFSGKLKQKQTALQTKGIQITNLINQYTQWQTQLKALNL
ncbi:MAG: hypothetical protein K0S74_254 [Chlamydiales bacterium]|jgi:hypothetical protein|nr:hypothetical protein [Chlamydiales bacterium]